MGRKKSNYNVTARHVRDVAVVDDVLRDPPRSTPRNRAPIGHLSYGVPTPKLQLHAISLALTLKYALPNTVLFPDTSFCSKKVPAPVWEAMLKHKIAFTPQIVGEVQPWQCNTAIRTRLQAAMSKRDSAIELLSVESPDRILGYEHYFRLLATRKQIGRFAAAECAERSRKSIEDVGDDELRTELTHWVDNPGLKLATKGWKERHKRNRFADEELVTAAVLTAIHRGVETVILTFDPDVFSQFEKITHLLIDNFKSMCVANAFVEQPELWPRCAFAVARSSRDLNDHTAIGLKLTNADVGECIRGEKSVVTYCWLLGNHFQDMRLSVLPCCLDTAMRELLRVKCVTEGANTDKLGGRNCRVSIQRNQRDNLVASTVIARDRVVSFCDGIFRARDLDETLRSSETVIVPAVRGFHDHPLINMYRPNRELVIATS